MHNQHTLDNKEDIIKHLRQGGQASPGTATFNTLLEIYLAFSALTLLAECQEGHLAHKNVTDEVLAW